MPETSWVLLSKPFVVSQNRSNYVDLRKRAEGIAQQTTGKFTAAYARFQSFDDMYHNVIGLTVQLLQEAADSLIAYLVENDIYDESSENLIGRALDESDVAQVYNDLDEWYQRQLDSVNASKEYLEARKEGRGRIIGGGFGLMGAAKGMLTAGVLNAASGAIHSMRNFADSTNIDANHETILNGKLNNPATLQDFKQALHSDVFRMMNCVVRTMEQNHKKAYDIPGDGDRNKAQAIDSNLNKLHLPPEKTGELCLQMLSLNPFREQHYNTIARLYPDQVPVLLKIGVYFGLELHDCAEAYIADAIADADLTSREEINHAMATVQKRMREANLTTCTAYRTLVRANNNLRQEVVEEGEEPTQDSTLRLYNKLDFTNENAVKNAEEKILSECADSMKPLYQNAFRVIHNKVLLNKALEYGKKKIHLSPALFIGIGCSILVISYILVYFEIIVAFVWILLAIISIIIGSCINNKASCWRVLSLKGMADLPKYNGTIKQ